MISQPAIRPLTPALGAEFVDVDLAADLDGLFPAVRRAFTDHRVLLFRDQVLPMDRQVALGRAFGEVQVHVMNQYHADDHPEVYFLTNLDQNGQPSGKHPDRGTLAWHTDGSWRERTGQATIMVADEVPREGGETHFCCMYGAYEALDEETKTRIEGLRAVHSLDYSRGIRHPEDPMTEAQKLAAPPVAHPIARTHPETGRKCLFLGDHAEHIEGMDYAKGRALIDELNHRAIRPEFVYEHRYRPGDVIIWDNRAVQHRATPYDTVHTRRVMRRTTVLGEVPV